MTEDEAKDWITKVGGNLETKQSIEGAKTIEEALKMKDLMEVELVVGNERVRAVFGSPVPPRSMLFPFMVQWFIQACGDPTKATPKNN